MSILSAYKTLQKEVKRQLKVSRDVYLCNVVDDLRREDIISPAESKQIIEDIQNHMESVMGKPYTMGTMSSCIERCNEVQYDDMKKASNDYRLKWVELQIVRYSLTPQ